MAVCSIATWSGCSRDSARWSWAAEAAASVGRLRGHLRPPEARWPWLTSTQSGADEAAAEAAEAGVEAVALAADVASHEDVDRFVGDAAGELGGLDILGLVSVARSVAAE